MLMVQQKESASLMLWKYGNNPTPPTAAIKIAPPNKSRETRCNNQALPQLLLNTASSLCHHRAVCPKVGQAGVCPPQALERMLRMCFIAQWFKLAEVAGEEFLYAPICSPPLPL